MHNIIITEGNIRNNHIYLTEILSKDPLFFPIDSRGGNNISVQANKSIRILTDINEEFNSDIDITKNIFRDRTYIKNFLGSGLKEGDIIYIYKLSEYIYFLARDEYAENELENILLKINDPTISSDILVSNLDSNLVLDLGLIKKSIEQYNNELTTDLTLTKTMGKVRSWVYSKSLDMFGPAKFVGYTNMTSHRYLVLRDRGLHGGHVNLEEFAAIASDKDSFKKLNIFLEQFDKTPIKDVKIWILNEEDNEIQVKTTSFESKTTPEVRMDYDSHAITKDNNKYGHKRITELIADPKLMLLVNPDLNYYIKLLNFLTTKKNCQNWKYYISPHNKTAGDTEPYELLLYFTEDGKKGNVDWIVMDGSKRTWPGRVLKDLLEEFEWQLSGAVSEVSSITNSVRLQIRDKIKKGIFSGQLGVLMSVLKDNPSWLEMDKITEFVNFKGGYTSKSYYDMLNALIDENLVERRDVNGKIEFRLKQEEQFSFEFEEEEIETNRTKSIEQEVRIRDQELVKKLKIMYNNTCQVCGESIRLARNSYSEAHHLHPLGSKEHNGPDVISNMIILCPNCHVQFDFGSMAINPDSLLIEHVDLNNKNVGKKVNLKHEIGTEHLRYHYDNIFRT